MEITNVAFEAEEVDPTAVETARQQWTPGPQQPARKSKLVARVRSVLLAVVIVLSGWLGYYVKSSINQINEDMLQIHARMVTTGELGPN
jgi:hypothetical protein